MVIFEGNKMLRKIKSILFDLLFVVSKFFPKNKNLWLFGAWQGKLYGDNSKYLFRYINKIHPEIKSIWISQNEEAVNKARLEGFKAFNKRALAAKWYSLRAAVVFETEGNNDHIAYLIGGAKKIQLWHGFGIKNNKKWMNDPKKFNKYKFQTLSYAHNDDYWMTACDEASKKYMDSYNLSEDRMFITGQPKDDTFVWKKPNETIDKIRVEHPGCRIFVYLPTHRNFGRTGDINPIMSIDALKQVNEKLRDTNIVMIFKPHFHEFAKYEGYTDSFSNIIFATDKDKYGDVYEFLPVCDGLVTDYSGIMFGYLASGKPIIYFTYDYDEYLKDDFGFYYNFDDITYGPVCRTWDEVVNNMKNITSEDYSSQREKLREKFCPYADGNSCERVYLKVKELLN